MSLRRIPILSGRFAFLSPDDPLCEGLPISSNATKVRLAGYDGVPMFALFYEKELLTLDPYEVLSLLAQERVFFPTAEDKEDFVSMLGSHLEAYDKANRRIRKITRAASIAGAIALSVASAAVVAASIISRRR